MKKTLDYAELMAGRAAVDYRKVGKVTAESVARHTGKDWERWVGILEKAGARAWNYREIVEYLRKKHRLTPWWQQGVALGFEIAIGRRLEGQDARGKYGVTATKSLSVDVRELWKRLVSPAGQAIWLRPLAEIGVRAGTAFETEDGFFGEIRTLAAHRRIRLYWQDPRWEKRTVVEVMLVPRPGKKSILAFNHTGIATTNARDSLRARWRAALEGISETLPKRVPRDRARNAGAGRR